MTIIRNPSAAGLSDPSIVRQTEAGLAQSSLIARGKPAVVNNGLVLPSTTLTTTSNTVVATTSQNNQSADTVTIYESSGNVYVSSIDQIVNKTTINNPVAGVGKIIAGDNITITSSNGDGTGNVTINSTGGGSGTPGGSNTQIQFNDAGSFGGNGGFTFNKTTGIFTSPFVAGNGNGLSNIQGANVSGAVGLATFAGTANAVAGGNVSGAVGLATYATTANAVAGGNVSGAVGLATYATTANAVAGGNVSGTVANANTALKIANGTSNINIPTVNGNILVTAGGSNVWTFDTSGNVSVPGGIIGSGNLKLSPDSTNVGAYLDVFLTSGPDVHLVASQSANLILGKDDQANVMTSWNGNVTIQSWDLNTNTSGGTWTFGGDGNLTTPGVSGNITGANVIEANTVTANTFASPGNLQLVAGEALWTLTDTGSTIFPTISVQRGDNPSGTITGQTLLFGDNTQEAIISTPDGNSTYNNSQRLVINPGAGATGTGGEGGDIYLWAGRGGNASGSGGDIKIRGGQGGANTAGGSGGDGGYIRMEAGDSSSAGAPGYVDINGGNSAIAGGGYVEILGGQGATVGGDANLKGGYGTATGGNVNIWGGGSGNGQVNEGHVNIQTGGYTWIYNASGNLTLPQGGIVHETTIPFGGLTGNTIALKPYGGINADQQLLVYPTAGGDNNHLHLTSGNLYNTELFLGDDNLYVKLANTGDIVINSNDDAGNTAQWIFGTDGNVSVPGNTLIYTPIATSGAGGNSITIQAGSSDSFASNPGGNLNLIGGYGSFGDGGGPPGGNVNIVSGDSSDSHAGNVTIATGSNDWIFDYTGNLTAPGEVIINSNNAHGGAGYAGIMTMTNTIGGSTNPNKFIRLNSTGNLEIINSGYTTTILGLSDSGNLTIPGTFSGNFAGNGGNITYQQTNTFYVDPIRTQNYTPTGTVLQPFFTVSAAISAAVTAGYTDSNPAFILLLSNITENITMQPGIFLTSLGTGTHGSPTITGTVTVSSGSGSISSNHYSISNLRIVAPTDGTCIDFTGSAAQRLFVRDVWLDANGSGTCIFMDNANGTSVLHINTGHLAHSGTGDVYCIDLTAGNCYITDIETSGNVQVAAVRTGTVMTIDSSEIDANNAAAIEVYGGTLTVTNSIITNAQANSNGVALNTTGSVCTLLNVLFSIPTGAGKAVFGTTTSLLFYLNVAFAPSTNTGKTASPALIATELGTTWS